MDLSFLILSWVLSKISKDSLDLWSLDSGTGQGAVSKVSWALQACIDSNLMNAQNNVVRLHVG
jgi:hypothetical protein